MQAVVELAHARGALVLLDAFQAIGSLPVDVAALGVDFLARGRAQVLARARRGSRSSIAAATCRARRGRRQTGWFADENIFAMDQHRLLAGAHGARFQSGTPPVPAIYAGIAGIELMQEIGIAATREHVRGLNAHLIDGLDELGAKLVTPRPPDRRGALMCVKSTDAKTLVTKLGEEGIVTSSRDDNLRISAHCYNTVEDVDTVLAALRRQRALLA